MGSTGPGAQQDPDEVAAVEPDAPGEQENAPASQLDLDDGTDIFRAAASTGLVEVNPRPGQIVTNESADAVQGAVVDEAPALAPSETQPSTCDFDTYFLTHYDRLVAAVRRYCAGDHTLAEDVVQMTFLKAYERCEQLAAQDNPYAWLLTVATRVAQDVFRREQLRIDREQDRKRLAGCADDEWEGRAWVIALRQLPPPEHQVMWYRFVLRYPRKTIAQELGISLRAVDYHIKRALGRLRQELDLSGED